MCLISLSHNPLSKSLPGGKDEIQNLWVQKEKETRGGWKSSTQTEVSLTDPAVVSALPSESSRFLDRFNPDNHRSAFCLLPRDWVPQEHGVWKLDALTRRKKKKIRTSK